MRRILNDHKSKGFLPVKKSDKIGKSEVGHPTFIRLFKIRFHSSNRDYRDYREYLNYRDYRDFGDYCDYCDYRNYFNYLDCLYYCDFH